MVLHKSQEIKVANFKTVMLGTIIELEEQSHKAMTWIQGCKVNVLAK